MASNPPKVFISYAWENEINEWVYDFALKLRGEGIDARIDQWETQFGDLLTQYMETSIRENDFVLIICTPLYKKKSERRTGGVGYEGAIITGEIFATENHRKFIPVLVKDDWIASSPSFLLSKLYCDLSSPERREADYEKLLKTLRGGASQLPPLGALPTKRIRKQRTKSIATKTEEPVSAVEPKRTRKQRTKSIPSKVEVTATAAAEPTAKATPGRKFPGGEILAMIREQLPAALRTEKTPTGATVFIDSRGRPRVEVDQYRKNCIVRVKSSSAVGSKNYRKNRVLLKDMLIESPDDVTAVVVHYDMVWRGIPI